MKKELLEIINESDEVIGLEEREKIHNEGLLHREVHVWFYTPEGALVLQHRAKDKDTYPDLLDATVGGHVEPGMTYEETVIKEAKEETGLDLNLDSLQFLRKLSGVSHDLVTHKINNAFRMQYAYLFKGNITDLKIEEGKALGFEVWPFDTLISPTEEEKKKFIPKFFDKEYTELFKQIKDLVN